MKQLFCIKEIGRYSVAGVSSTLLDWAIFYVLAILWHIHYQAALISALLLSSIFNYQANKRYTFKSTCPKGFRQFLSYLSLVLFSLLLSIGCMHLLVDQLSFAEMTARIITTLLLASVNYFLTKHISFNQRFFKDTP